MIRCIKAMLFLSLQVGLLCAGPAGEKQTKSVHLGQSVLASYVGQFRDESEPERVLSFSVEEARLYVQSTHIAKAELTPISKAEFTSNEGSVHYLFNGARHKAALVQWTAGAESGQAVRVSDQPEHFVLRPYSRLEVMIPTRDGVKLHAIILRPTDARGPLPFLLSRTPYGIDQWTPASLNALNSELAASGYIFVMQDIRGRYKSEGHFEMMRPLVDHSDPKQIDESTDAFDTVVWLLKNIPENNGRVGVVGISYPGFLTSEAGIDPHPAVKAISPQAPMTDVWLGDDFFHNGAFRETYGYDYAIGLESSNQNAFGKLDQDAFDYFLHSGSFINAARTANIVQLPSSRSFVEHPAYDSFWQARAVEAHLKSVLVPTLFVGGWWDQEDMWGPQAQYAALEPEDTSHQNFLVLGPWNHGQWAGSSRHLGNLDFGAPIGDQFRQQFEVPFFAHYLKDESGFDLQDTASFQTGTNRWMRYAHWPPKERTQKRNLYLAEDGALTFDTPASGDETHVTTYLSDPASPVPYRKRPIETTYAPTGSGWYTWLVQDQRFLNGRKDVVSWSTSQLKTPITVTGDILADIFASTSGTDSDWVVKLIDVYPDSPQLGKLSGDWLMIASEIFRGRYWKGFDNPKALPAQQAIEYKFSLHGADHVFLKGHRIMLQVQSTWFPLYDRNPQQFVQNIMTANKDDYKAATQKVYWSSEHPSHIELPIGSE